MAHNTKMARPREFDYDHVVSKVTDLFWEKGFHSTSLDDIMTTTGLNKGSLYASFGNKETLFRIALKKYIGDGPFEKFRQSDRSPDPIHLLVLLYRKLISETQLSKLGKRGCFAFNSGLEFGNQGTKLSRFVLSEVGRLESFFHQLIEEAQESTFLPKTLDVRKAAFRAFAAAFTIREMAKFRPDRQLLEEIANTALASLGTEQRV